MNLYSYVVRYDSGFAPNPFYGVCTLATCKGLIRGHADVGDWLVGVGSASQKIQQGGRLVYAMRVSEKITFNEYYNDLRFQAKKANLTGSRKQARGDNIYHMISNDWHQLDSFHSNEDGSPNIEHIEIDTEVDSVLIGKEFIYFGKDGPFIPNHLASDNKRLCHVGIGSSKFITDKASDNEMISDFLQWYDAFEEKGYISHPFDWSDNQ